jgi:hypothetical protein
MISVETARAIAYAHREIEVAEKLLADINESMQRRQAPDIRDVFGRLQSGLQLGVPTGDSSQRLFNVEWSLARPVIEAHIANQRAQVAALNEKARAELGAT